MLRRHDLMLDPRSGQAPPGAYNTVPLPRSSGLRLRLLAIIGLCLLVAGWLAGLTATRRGWLTIGLAGLAVVLLAVHYRDGGGRWLFRVVCEYAAVAALAVLLVIAAGGTPQQPPAHHQPATATTAGEQFCPKPVQAVAGGACDFIAELWHHTQHRTGQQPVSPTTTRPPRR
jgi:hypothetical protein